MRKLLQDKKGASLSGWSEVGIALIVIMVLFGLIMVSMNTTYNKNYDVTFGINTDSDYSNFSNYQGTLGTSLDGDTTQNDFNGGFTLLTSWNIIKSGITIVWSLLTGQWIANAVGLLHLDAGGTILAWGLRLIYIFSLGFILIKILFKIKP